jgi:hypothetical protein
MTRFTKALVLAGAAAMILSPIAAGAAGSALPVLAQGVSQAGGDDDNDDRKGLGGLTIGAIVLGLALGGLLVAGGSGGSSPQSN